MRIEDLPVRTVLMLDRDPPKKVDMTKYPRQRPPKPHRTLGAKDSVTAPPVNREAGWCDIHDNVPIPGIRKFKIPADIGKYAKGLRRPWAKTAVGQSFFVPGAAYVGVPGEGGKWATRVMFINGIPGTMVWRLK